MNHTCIEVRKEANTTNRQGNGDYQRKKNVAMDPFSISEFDGACRVARFIFLHAHQALHLAPEATAATGGRAFRFGGAQGQELSERRRKVLEEQFLVGLVLLGPFSKSRVLGQHQVRGEHHQLAVGRLVLRGALPGALLLVALGHLGGFRGPFLFVQEAEVLVGEGGLGAGPWAPVGEELGGGEKKKV